MSAATVYSVFTENMSTLKLDIIDLQANLSLKTS